VLAEKLTRLIYSEYAFSDYGRTWLDDREFFRMYDRLNPADRRSADRKFFLRSLLGLVDDVPGDTAECGVYRGASSYIISRYSNGADRTHHAFDSWEGVSEPGVSDGRYWRRGDLAVSEASARQNLAGFPSIKFHKGWIPDSFAAVEGAARFAFVHIDVDLYQPTLDSLTFFYPRLNAGALVVCDDYGASSCPGVTRACETFLAGKEERLVHAPTGQGFFIKH
jgi:hypothetical protein